MKTLFKHLTLLLVGIILGGLIIGFWLFSSVEKQRTVVDNRQNQKTLTTPDQLSHLKQDGIENNSKKNQQDFPERQKQIQKTEESSEELSFAVSLLPIWQKYQRGCVNIERHPAFDSAMYSESEIEKMIEQGKLNPFSVFTHPGFLTYNFGQDCNSSGNLEAWLDVYNFSSGIREFLTISEEKAKNQDKEPFVSFLNKLQNILRNRNKETIWRSNWDVPGMNAACVWRSHVKFIDTPYLRGVRYVAAACVQADFVIPETDQSTYFFQGISKDGKRVIFFTQRGITARPLVDYYRQQNLSAGKINAIHENPEKFNTEIQTIKQKFLHLQDSDFEPALNSLDEFIFSLK